ncbi:MAG: hypothetical protein Hyperionvirus10_14 [Hyperionvirus sp.]|uniref:WWE domain-containing protein n=1 Tax=Hyperionvirus sp. TaxID=2487770 RepID=A0A3G5A8V0_9VIRU|nr:MAG: hypothetical protein Hyperionvirus10_14 [Hyperionvirus sp.]
MSKANRWFFAGSTKWQAYPDNLNEKLNGAYEKKLPGIVIRTENVKRGSELDYWICFDSFVQINLATCIERKIICCDPSNLPPKPEHVETTDVGSMTIVELAHFFFKTREGIAHVCRL